MDFNNLSSSSKALFVFFAAIVLGLTIYIGYQQFILHYIVGINGWGLGFCFLFFYVIFESGQKMAEKENITKSDRYLMAKYISGFFVGISAVMAIFGWEIKNLNIVFWFLFLSLVAILYFAAFSISAVTDSAEKIAVEKFRAADHAEYLNSMGIDDDDDDFEDDTPDYRELNAKWAADNRFPEGANGNHAKFDYESKDGYLGDWEIVDWYATDIMIKGKLARNGEERTFKKEKISNWVAGQSNAQ